MSPRPDAPPIFIVSPVKRSGTNYVKNLLCKHPDCFSPGPIWEDDILRKAHLLEDFVDLTFDHWNPAWQVEAELAPRAVMLSDLGAALSGFLARQMARLDAREDVPPRRPGAPARRFVTKSPKADNLALFPRLFPDAQLLIVVRDGMAVAQSAATSFSKPRDLAIREWARGMNRIEAFLASPAFDPALHRLIRYEDMVQNTEAEMRALLAFLELDPEAMDWAALRDLPVYGSSALKADGGPVHWAPVKRHQGFAPLDRAKAWRPGLRSHHGYLVGQAGRFAGYEPPPVEGWRRPLHMLRAAFWWPAWRAWLAARVLREDMRRSLPRMLGR